MSDTSLTETLAALGFHAAPAGESVEIRPAGPGHEWSDGYAGGATAVSFSISFPELEAFGFAVEQAETRSLRITASSAVRVHPDTLPPTAERLPNGILLRDGQLHAPILLVLENATGLLLASDAAGGPVEATPFTLSTLPIERERPGLRSDVESWAAACEDSWLSEAVARQVGQDWAWPHAVAVGMVLRLSRPSSGQRAARVRAAVDGAVPEPEASIRSWAAGLSGLGGLERGHEPPAPRT